MKKLHLGVWPFIVLIMITTRITSLSLLEVGVLCLIVTILPLIWPTSSPSVGLNFQIKNISFVIPITNLA
uniref:Uncharacterized protein n=1 Tax=Kalanchoe fedtschenkoi TaxID=63787 RepID=A0A7N0V9X7_KALFE